MWLVITAKSNKWQQALGFVSCAQVSKGSSTQKNLNDLRRGLKKACVSRPEYEQVMVEYKSIGYGIFFLAAAMTNTKVYQKKTLYVLRSK